MNKEIRNNNTAEDKIGQIIGNNEEPNIVLF